MKATSPMPTFGWNATLPCATSSAQPDVAMNWLPVICACIVPATLVSSLVEPRKLSLAPFPSVERTLLCHPDSARCPPQTNISLRQTKEADIHHLQAALVPSIPIQKYHSLQQASRLLHYQSCLPSLPASA
ncbi:hypothetical protein K440DRAFT_122199 [Wilcoxina mikolae CBS 423.85]|nr:hypothetical protein K440DRAFT_122199 [Wilcoxina mikolae CBS 423.85]